MRQRFQVTNQVFMSRFEIPLYGTTTIGLLAAAAFSQAPVALVRLVVCVHCWLCSSDGDAALSGRAGDLLY